MINIGQTLNKALLLSVLVALAASSRANAAVASAPKEPVYVCHRATSRIKIDGNLNDRAWRKAQVIKAFLVPVTMKPATSKTEARLLWDDQYLYVAFKAKDKDVRALLAKRDAPTCTEDCLEFFVKPSAKNTAYCNFEINALNTVFDARNPSRLSPGSEKWTCKGLKTAVVIKGTINNPSDVDSYWQLEEAIPLKELPLANGALPKVGDTWTFHVARYDYSKYLPKGVELSSSARLTKVDFHTAEEWCTLKFVK